MVSHSILSITDDDAWVCLTKVLSFKCYSWWTREAYSVPSPYDKNYIILGVIGHKMPWLQCHRIC